MNDIEEIEKSADEDIRTFGQLMDIVVEKLTYGALMLRERGVRLRQQGGDGAGGLPHGV